MNAYVVRAARRAATLDAAKQLATLGLGDDLAGEGDSGGVWALPDGRNVLIISLTGLEEAYGAVLAIVLHDSGRYPDTAVQDL
ncbi:hypothetical protein [Streptomyces sp. NA03103]|uniref:hypothetical protein n=1 Tax=unclassified Streptomyces TaxID=2593676 RepID=UPI0020CAB837|nr:hypothetical protein [Streptomyces sp. NA03103]